MYGSYRISYDEQRSMNVELNNQSRLYRLVEVRKQAHMFSLLKTEEFKRMKKEKEEKDKEQMQILNKQYLKEAYNVLNVNFKG